MKRMLMTMALGALATGAFDGSADTLKLLHDVYGSYTGYAEELRIHRGRVDDAWMKAEYLGMLDTFATVGPVETLIGAGTMILVR